MVISGLLVVSDRADARGLIARVRPVVATLRSVTGMDVRR